MIAIVLVVLYAVVLPVVGLWFVQSRLPKLPTEFELRLAKMRRDIALVQVQLGEQLLPVLRRMNVALTQFAEAFKREAW